MPTRHLQRYTSPAATLRAAHDKETLTHPNESSEWLQYDYAHPSRSRAKWLGFDKVPQNGKLAVEEELTRGWPDGASLLSRTSEQVSAQVPASRKLKVENGHTSGFDPSVPALYSGDPRAFRRWGTRPRAQIIRLGMNLAAPFHKDASSLVWSGAAAMVLADLYTNSGYQVEIFALNSVDNNSRAQTLSIVPVKEAHEALLPDLLASVLVSPRFYRVGVIPLCWHVESHFGQGAGAPVDVTEKDILEHAPDLAPMVCLPRVYSEATAVLQINSTIERFSQ